MPTTLLTIGPVHILPDNDPAPVAFALPARRVLATVQPNNAVIEVSNNQVDWDPTPQPIGTEPRQFEISAAFIRCNDATGATIVLKAY